MSVLLVLEMFLFIILLIVNIVITIIFPPYGLTFIAFATWLSSWRRRWEDWT